MERSVTEKLLESWAAAEGRVSSTAEILAWIEEKNREIFVKIEPCGLSECAPWSLHSEEGVIRNEAGTFFSVAGLRVEEEGRLLSADPVIVQPEIGYLGILVREIDGIYHFLMQAKIEPGNLNKIQLSPTIQATRSNFTRVHQGKEPAYLQYFREAGRHTVLTDQLQSEQSSRFYRKRNRNLVVLVEGEVACLPSHRWMTLGQIKTLLKRDNLVNMDTRTVLSALPVPREALPPEAWITARSRFSNPTFAESLLEPPEQAGISEAWQRLNDARMFDNKKRTLVGLDALSGWQVTDRSIAPVPGHAADYEVIFCRIEIEGREVRRWTQPLFRARGKALFGLLMSDRGGKRRFLCRLREEPGCFDVAEFGPTIQREARETGQPPRDAAEALFWEEWERGSGVAADVLLSEEGGRFYHEQNRNLLILTERELPNPPPGYLWLDYAQLSRLMESSCVLNIQLRNLLSLLDI